MRNILFQLNQYLIVGFFFLLIIYILPGHLNDHILIHEYVLHGNIQIGMIYNTLVELGHCYSTIRRKIRPYINRQLKGEKV